MDFKTRYQQLNSAQKQAVDQIDGPIMVVAGPGTGKTELLGVRVANILSKTDTLPENILCLTFTESGATAMRERLVSIIGKDGYKVAIHTFHGFGTEIINQNREYFYRGALFEPADDLSRYEILRTIFDELDYKNPLASTMNGEYTHQPDATTVISELKRSGLTSDELLAVIDASEMAIDAAERIIAPLITGTVTVKVRDALAGALPQLQTLADNAQTLFEVPPMAQTIYDGLLSAVELSESSHPTKPITAWKKKWFIKNQKGEYIFKSRPVLIKLRALAFVYYEYLNRMEQAGLYDYDDMILQVVHAMEVHDELRYNLQEKYLYIMVDEFQDTNLAQMRILHNLTDNPANEGRPNILVVGDDDQAIYSFQGADISNILRFKELYSSAELVVLTENYRSGAGIIERARKVITQGSDRLENRIETLTKQLNAQHSNASVELFHAPTIDSERHWVVESIKRGIKGGIKGGIAPQDIAVLSRRHHEIQHLLPYFDKAGIAVNYTRQDNVLDQPPIVALELLARVIVAIGKGEHDQANSLMPQLLAHPAWGISPLELWELSTTAYSERKPWLNTMTTLPRFLDTHSWLIEQATLSQHTALEPMIDRLIGRNEDSNQSVKNSPFFDYFFSAEQLEKAPAQYLDCLAALRTIRAQLREYHAKETLNLEAFVEFVGLHRRLGTNLMVAKTSLDSEVGAVNLMTAHGSKGLEFDTVYVLNAVDNVWGEKARSVSRNIGYPENLPLAPAGESSNERLRLFYVAMTRAKSRLIVSYSDTNDSDKATLIASFLSEDIDNVKEIPATTGASLIEAAELAWYEPFVQPSTDLKKLLQPTLEHYKLSATHINAFLDVSRGGPQHFLLNHLLHFPSAKSASASYGSAIHRTLQQAHIHVTASGEQKPLEDILRDFEANLTNEHLSTLDYATYHQKGSEQLQAFLVARYDSFVPSQKAELSFANQEVHLGDAHLTGMIDVATLYQKDKSMTVTDYKTGKPSLNWKGGDEFEKIKLYKYRQQLLFYKLMVEHSRDYGIYTVTSGSLSFIEPTKSGEVVALDMSFDIDEVDRFEQLISKVWKHIINLDLPDVSAYPPTLKGMLAFEQDLLDESV
ncbi:MAG: ATP-dependent DNA helicase [Candidatus Microsaccharimonas sp.]